jgi:hypothetical protein
VPALNYFDGYTCEFLPANLLQAQRDYFGAHTYERLDAPRGQFFHTNWPAAAAIRHRAPTSSDPDTGIIERGGTGYQVPLRLQDKRPVNLSWPT